MSSSNRTAQQFSVMGLGTYVPSYNWVDDERDTRNYIRYYTEKKDENIDYVPVYKIMKEYYDEEKNAIYRSESFSSNEYSDYNEYEQEYGEYYRDYYEEYHTDSFNTIEFNEPCSPASSSNYLDNDIKLKTTELNEEEHNIVETSKFYDT
jgi:hypothetical protein